MDSIVLELQREAMSSGSNISNLLRKSLVISRKLKITDFEHWVNQELNGYGDNGDIIPDYREVRGSLEFLNHYYGWRPVIIQDEKLAEILSKQKIAQPITEIEFLVESDSDQLYIQLPQNIQNQLSEWGDRTPTQFHVSFGKSQARQIIDSVRNIILDWAIQLEEDGILGEGILFSEKEKAKADRQNYTVNNFYGNASGVQIQQNTSHSTQTIIGEMDFDNISNFISTLKENMNQIGLQAEEQRVIESEVATISTQLESTQPRSSIVKQSLKTVRSVLEGVTGSIIASGLLHELSKIPLS